MNNLLVRRVNDPSTVGVHGLITARSISAFSGSQSWIQHDEGPQKGARHLLLAFVRVFLSYHSAVSLSRANTSSGRSPLIPLVARVLEIKRERYSSRIHQDAVCNIVITLIHLTKQFRHKVRITTLFAHYGEKKRHSNNLWLSCSSKQSCISRPTTQNQGCTA